MKLLSTGHAGSVEAAIAFLAADPDFFRSGYIKQSIARKLKTIPLSNHFRSALQDVLIELIQKPARREYIEYARLARTIVDDHFMQKLQNIAQDINQSAIARANAEHFLTIMAS
jgi:hypothetical protein